LEITKVGPLIQEKREVPAVNQVAGSLDESPVVAPTMSPWCVLAQPLHPLSHAIVAKAALKGVNFLATAEACAELRLHHAPVLAVFPGALAALTDEARMLLEPEGTEAAHLLIGVEAKPVEGIQARALRILQQHREGDPREHEITVHLHDVLPPERGSDREAMFRAWMEAARAGTQPNLHEQRFHWCDLNDVTSAVSDLLQQPCEDGEYHVSGRRAWTMDETWQEFDALVQRTIAGKTGKFGTEHLESRGVPVVEAVALRGGETARARPDLGPLHDALTKANGEGWRPRTPLRQSLMMVIAQLSETQPS
jgi:hypothetical protein